MDFFKKILSLSVAGGLCLLPDGRILWSRLFAHQAASILTLQGFCDFLDFHPLDSWQRLATDPQGSPGEMQALMKPLGITYDGDADPIELERKPGVDLR